MWLQIEHLQDDFKRLIGVEDTIWQSEYSMLDLIQIEQIANECESQGKLCFD